VIKNGSTKTRGVLLRGKQLEYDENRRMA